MKKTRKKTIPCTSTELVEKFVEDNNRQNKGRVFISQEGNGEILRIEFQNLNCRIGDQNRWSRFRNEILFGTHKLVQVVTDKFLAENYSHLNLETTQEAFNEHGLLFCQIKEPVSTNNAQYLDWLVNSFLLARPIPLSSG